MTAPHRAPQPDVSVGVHAGGGAGADAPTPDDRYDVLGALAAGHHSMIYLALARARASGVAEGTRPQALVAVKRPHPGFARDAATLDAFAREGRFAARVSSPHVVTVTEIDEDAHGPFMVMEYVAGPCLARLQCIEIDGATVLTRLSTAVAVRIVLDVLAGLHALHTTSGGRGGGDAAFGLPIVHGDLCPSNVLVGADGVSKVADFGAARVAGTAGFPSPHGLAPSPAYQAPEAILDGRIDPRADVFATGVLLWELCAGRRLFAAPTPQMIARQVLGGYVPDLRQIATSVPVSVVAVCEKALERDPADRFASATEFATALENAMNDAFGIPRHEAVAHLVRLRCAALLAQRARLVEAPDASIQSGVRVRRARVL